MSGFPGMVEVGRVVKFDNICAGVAQPADDAARVATDMDAQATTARMDGLCDSQLVGKGVGFKGGGGDEASTSQCVTDCNHMCASIEKQASKRQYIVRAKVEKPAYQFRLCSVAHIQKPLLHAAQLGGQAEWSLVSTRNDRHMIANCLRQHARSGDPCLESRVWRGSIGRSLSTSWRLSRMPWGPGATPISVWTTSNTQSCAPAPRCRWPQRCHPSRNPPRPVAGLRRSVYHRSYTRRCCCRSYTLTRCAPGE